jgi:hypothetical protein
MEHCMRIRYYVLARHEHFEVYRESVQKGRHVLRNRALESATTMARLETRFAGTATEVLMEEADGRFRGVGSFDAGALPSEQPRWRRAGGAG